MKEITLEDLLEHFPEESREAIVKLYREPDTQYLVLFEVFDQASPSMGSCTVLTIGPSRSHHTLSEIEDTHIFEVPSRRQFPTSYVKK